MQGIKKKIQLLDKQIFSKSDLERFLKKIPENYSIYDLTRDGKILKVIKRDAYYLNILYPKIVNPFVIGATYCEYRNYMFGGLALYNRYGFTTQVANKYTIYTTKYYGTKKVLDTFYNFKKVKKEVIYAYKEKMIDGVYVRMMTTERAFIEFCRENRTRMDTLREIYKTKIDQQLFIKTLKKYPYQNIRQFIQKEIIA
ncbi:MAG: hypothetical protein GXP45_01640 [bacterium]|nr:hypothetical protein [bacterium]